MSRRRATEEAIVVSDDTLPGPKKDSATNGKQRSASERLSKFIKNRPVSALLLFTLIFSVSIATYSVGRFVGKTIIHVLIPSKTKTTTTSHSSTSSSTTTKLTKHDTNSSLSSKDSSCYRKFEPGKLRWSKTLCVTDEYYFDMSVGNVPIGTFKIGVFGNVVPKSAANFKSLVTCTGAFSDESLCYRHDSFHRVVSNFVIQGGSKATGHSIYGPTFREEQSKDHHSFLSHAEKGVVSWAEYPIGSQFYILMRSDAVHLDKNHVVFGIITDGMKVLEKILDAPRKGEEPNEKVKITACGRAH